MKNIRLLPLVLLLVVVSPAAATDDWFTGRLHTGSQGGYPSYWEIRAGLQAAANGLKHAEYVVLGKSREGKDISALVFDRAVANGGKAKAAVVVTGMTQPREILSTMQVLALVKVLAGKGPATNAALVDRVLDSTRIVLVPVMNPDGYEAVKVSFHLRDDLAKNARHTCMTNVSHSGVNLGHNWGFKWGESMTIDPCQSTYQGPDPFSEPETVAVSEMIMRERPKGVVFMHSRAESHTSRIVVPYTYHKSLLSHHKEDKKNRLMAKSDLDAYETITTAMSLNATSSYEVGTAWELMNHTVSGSEIDWTFDQAGAFALILQVGTANKTYWPEDPESLVDPHIVPLLMFMEVAKDLPAKATPKGRGYHVANTVPIYLGLILLAVLAGGFLVARYWFGYDDVVGRFKTWTARLQRQWASRVGYRGVPTTVKEGSDGVDAGDDDDLDMFLELDGGPAAIGAHDVIDLDLDAELGLNQPSRGGGRGVGGRGGAVGRRTTGEDDDEGVGYSYR